MPLADLMTHDKKRQLSPSSSDVPVGVFIIVVERMKKAFHMIPVSSLYLSSLKKEKKLQIKKKEKKKDRFLCGVPSNLFICS